MLVVDASAILEHLKGSDRGRRLFQRIEADPHLNLQAPHLIDLEVSQTLRRWRLKAGLPDEIAAAWLAGYLAIPIHRHAHVLLMSRIWELRDNLTCYDASYVALAESLGAPLLTADGRLRSARWHAAQIQIL